MSRSRLLTFTAAAAALACTLPLSLSARAGDSGPTILVRTRAGSQVEGPVSKASLQFERDGKSETLSLKKVLSIRFGGPATAGEKTRIEAGLAALQGMDRKQHPAAVEELTELGLATLTPLLDAYKDTDNHEPKPLYRLFERLVPGRADNIDRTLDLVRLTDGRILRGRLADAMLSVNGTSLNTADLRSLAVRQKVVTKDTPIHSLYHCSEIEWLDSGIVLGKDSRLEEDCSGFVRLAFNGDGWTSDPDGLKKPGPNYKTNLVNGFPFGALVGRVGANGERWLAGRHVEKTGLSAGHLYFAVNDNPHWQNNLGSYHLRVRATDAYDVNDPQ